MEATGSLLRYISSIVESIYLSFSLPECTFQQLTSPVIHPLWQAPHTPYIILNSSRPYHTPTYAQSEQSLDHPFKQNRHPHISSSWVYKQRLHNNGTIQNKYYEN